MIRMGAVREPPALPSVRVSAHPTMRITGSNDPHGGRFANRPYARRTIARNVSWHPQGLVVDTLGKIEQTLLIWDDP
jgi:hypothetical protein